MNKTIERAFELKDLIKKYDYQYYELGDSEISDVEYDRIYDEYRLLSQLFPEVNSDNSPLNRVGAGNLAGTSSGLPKFVHKSPLLSIERKAKEVEELKDFFEKCGGEGVEFIIEPKLDGITCNINYESGKLCNAATRGNGEIGELITDNFVNTETIYPKTVNPSYSLEIRGEAILPYDFFKKNLVNEYSNTRNAVSGIMRQIDSEEVKGKGIHVMFYDFGKTEQFNLSQDDYENVCSMKELGFESIPVIKVSSWKELEKATSTKMNGMIQEIDGFNVLVADGYPQAVCDGLVIKVNNLHSRDEIGMTLKGPKWAFALKFKPLQATTRIDHIEWQVGKTGKITPVAVFDEISLGGTKITRATLNNYDYMNSLPVLHEVKTDYSSGKPKIKHYPTTGVVKSMNDVKPHMILKDLNFKDTMSEYPYVKVGSHYIAEDGFYLDDEDYGGEWYSFEEGRYILDYPRPLFDSDNDEYVETINGIQMKVAPHGLKYDDVIIVERSNDVIPRIVGIHCRGNFIYPQDIQTTNIIRDKQATFSLPKICPVCGGNIKEEFPLAFCINENCPSRQKGKLEHFVSRDAMNITGLGESLIDIFYNKRYIQQVSDIYLLKNHTQNILKLDGFKDKKINNILASIEKSKSPKLWQFIYALSIPLVGKKTAKDLAKKFKTLNNFLKIEKSELLNTDDIGELTAEKICAYISNEDNIKIINDLVSFGVKPIEEKCTGEKYKNQTFVITGKFDKPRTFYQELIESEGGIVNNSVSKNTNVVLIGTDAGSKEKKAKDLVAKGALITIVEGNEAINKYLGEQNDN